MNGSDNEHIYKSGKLQYKTVTNAYTGVINSIINNNLNTINNACLNIGISLKII